MSTKPCPPGRGVALYLTESILIGHSKNAARKPYLPENACVLARLTFRTVRGPSCPCQRPAGHSTAEDPPRSVAVIPRESGFRDAHLAKLERRAHHY